MAGVRVLRRLFERADASQQLESVDFRHADVADEHVRALALRSSRSASSAVAGGDHRRRAIVEDALDQVPRVRLVVDHQHLEARQVDRTECSGDSRLGARGCRRARIDRVALYDRQRQMRR